MNASIRSWEHALPAIAAGEKSISQIAFCLLGLLLTAFVAHAASVTVNLGLSAENFSMAGNGPNASGLGTYTITMGACIPTGSNTTCTLSGSFTGATPGFTSGTYSLVSTYAGAGPTPFLGVEQAAGSNFFQFSSIPQTATMTLTLISETGTVIVPMLSSDQFVTGNSFGFVYNGSAVCSGPVSSCNVAQVGLTAGSNITGPVTGTATFVQSSRAYYISQLAFGGGYQSTFTLVNYSPQAVTCVTNFYADSGSPLQIPFSVGAISTRTDSLQPGQVVHDQTTADLSTPVASEGWAQATCTGPVQASILYRYYKNGVASGEAGVNAETAPTTKFVTFASTGTGVAYGNPSPTQTATITLSVFSAAGAPLASKIITLVPLAHGAANLGPLLGLQSFTGFMEITASIPIISLSLNAEVYPVFSSLPPGDLPGSTTLVTP